MSAKLCFVMVFALGACGGKIAEEASAADQSLTDGKTEVHYRAAMLLEEKVGSKGAWYPQCGAVLIDEDFAITPASCIGAGNTLRVNYAADFTVYPTNKNVALVTRVTIDPDADLALLRLATVVPLPYATVIENGNGGPMRLIGFAADDSDKVGRKSVRADGFDTRSLIEFDEPDNNVGEAFCTLGLDNGAAYFAQGTQNLLAISTCVAEGEESVLGAVQFTASMTKFIAHAKKLK